jgi:flagellar hook-associated protein 3 FlgL
MSGISTYALNKTLLSASLRTQTSLAQKQTQEATGVVSGTYGGYGASSQRMISLANEIDQSQSWADNAELAGSRTETMYSAVGDMVDLISNLRADISAAMSDTSNTTLNAEGQSTLEQLATLMNTKSEGRYIFAGSQTDTAPVDLDSYSMPTDMTTADTSYYQGDDITASVQVSESQSIDYGVAGNSSAFEKALRAASAISQASTNPIDTDALQAAYDLATEALNELSATQGSLSISASRLENAQQTQETFISYAQDTVDNIKNVDVAQVASEATQYQALLEASYSAISSASKMHLVDFM